LEAEAEGYQPVHTILNYSYEENSYESSSQSDHAVDINARIAELQLVLAALNEQIARAELDMRTVATYSDVARESDDEDYTHLPTDYQSYWSTVTDIEYNKVSFLSKIPGA